MKNQHEYLDQIRQIVVENLHPERVWLFGSRAEDNNRKQSDYDLAFEGGNPTFRKIRKVKEQISDLIGIYSCDLVNLEKINDDFKKLIQEKGKIIYESN